LVLTIVFRESVLLATCTHTIMRGLGLKNALNLEWSYWHILRIGIYHGKTQILQC